MEKFLIGGDDPKVGDSTGEIEKGTKSILDKIVEAFKEEGGVTLDDLMAALHKVAFNSLRCYVNMFPGHKIKIELFYLISKVYLENNVNTLLEIADEHGINNVLLIELKKAIDEMWKNCERMEEGVPK